jgi:predicted transposase YbfD/YdcC
MSQPCRPLKDVVAEIADPRAARGKRHRLEAILALVCVATLCGYRSYGAMAEWGRHYGAGLMAALGFTHPTPPCAATLHRVLRRLDQRQVEAVLGAWAEGVLASVPGPAAEGAGLVEREGVAIDGKRLRGSHKQGAPGTHLLAAVSQRLGLTLAHEAVDDKTNEITAVQTVLRDLVVAGRVITVDALLTQRAVAQTIVDNGGAYVMVAKDNQPGLRQTIAAVLTTPAHVPGVPPLRHARTEDRGHGRLERRALTVRALLPGDCDWPEARQVFRIERRRIRLCTGEVSTEAIEGVTNLAVEDDSPRALLRFLRDHWRIENGVHWVRDVTFDEDRSHVRCGAIPGVMAAVRAAAIGLLRAHGETNIARACRRNAAQPRRALALIGID